MISDAKLSFAVHHVGIEEVGDKIAGVLLGDFSNPVVRIGGKVFFEEEDRVGRMEKQDVFIITNLEEYDGRVEATLTRLHTEDDGESKSATTAKLKGTSRR